MTREQIEAKYLEKLNAYEDAWDAHGKNHVETKAKKTELQCFLRDYNVFIRPSYFVSLPFETKQALVALERVYEYLKTLSFNSDDSFDDWNNHDNILFDTKKALLEFNYSFPDSPV